MTKVYHFSDEKFRYRDGVFPDDYKLVAVVGSDDLERVYGLTNSVESPWTDNKGLIAFDPPHRSSSVHDVFVTDKGVFEVAPLGFKELEAEPPVVPAETLREWRRLHSERVKELKTDLDI